jgi:hypothetical protein
LRSWRIISMKASTSDGSPSSARRCAISGQESGLLPGGRVRVSSHRRRVRAWTAP